MDLPILWMTTDRISYLPALALWYTLPYHFYFHLRYWHNILYTKNVCFHICTSNIIIVLLPFRCLIKSLILRFGGISTNERLKAADQMAWTRKMNAIRNFAMEIINQDIIFVRWLISTGAMIILHHLPDFIYSLILDYSLFVSGALIVPLIE